MTIASSEPGATCAEDGTAPYHNSEVRRHLKFVLLSILFGVLFMAGTGIWAWKTYAPAIDQAPPLPSGVPSFTSSPAKSP